ncbi:protein FAM200B-like [Melanaphis sacchari]|uniref:protein FAM200B-like n=1 Tax=Melanaphis sacchari TaxID=742174 RepID=UPI000DC1485F|nr:protein FAM200B-like [Melanaphis sacchari]
MKRLLSTDAQSIFNTLCEVIEQYEIQWQSVSSVCFDGAAAMSGGLNGVQAKFKEKNDKTVFVHCYGHCLNLVLVDSLGRQNRVTFDFFGTIQLIYNFIESSSTRHATLEKVANSANIKLKTLKSVSNTRWACRAEAVSAVKSDYGPILIAIQEIGDATKQLDVRAKALGLIHQMKTFDFIFAQQMLHSILTLILKVSMALQSSNLDLITAVSLIKSLKLSLKSMRNDKDSFKNIYNKTLEICEENNISIPDVKKRRVSSKIDYVMISSISDRFKQETLELIKSVGNMLKLETNNEDTIIIASAFNLEFHGLESEIILLKKLENIPKGSNQKACEEWIQWLTNNNSDRTAIFNNFFKAIKSFVVIPVTSCSCERSFSKLSIVKSKLRSTMGQDRLDGLLTMFIEQDMAYNINVDELSNISKSTHQPKGVWIPNIVKDEIYSAGCNAQKPIDPEEKFAVFLR